MRGRVMEKSNEFLKLRMNFDLFKIKHEISRSLSLLDQKLDLIKDSDVLFYRKERFSSKTPILKFAILDFECNPTRVVGVLIAGQIFQFYIKNQLYQRLFFDLIMEILSILKDFYIFSFSNHEQHVIQEISRSFNFLSTKKSQPISFIRKLKIVNVQRFSFEGLIPALYSIDKKAYDDPLLRDSKKVNLHFKKGHYGLVLAHNKSCLLSILKLVKYRYLKETIV